MITSIFSLILDTPALGSKLCMYYVYTSLFANIVLSYGTLDQFHFTDHVGGHNFFNHCPSLKKIDMLQNICCIYFKSIMLHICKLRISVTCPEGGRGGGEGNDTKRYRPIN